MTPDRLRELVLKADVTRLAEELSPLGERERSKLSKLASRLDRQMRTARPAKPVPDASDRLRAFKTRAEAALLGGLGDAWVASTLAVLGLGPLEAAKRVKMPSMTEEQERALLKILRDRRPAWMDAWLQHELEPKRIRLSWEAVRSWVVSGVCRRPRADGYIVLLARGPKRWEEQHWRSTSEGVVDVRLSIWLLNDPELLRDEIWRLFEVRTSVFSNKHWKTPFLETWAHALRYLCELGHLNRARLLDASLTALSADFSASALSGLRDLHLSLRPTLQEVKEREGAFLNLLNSRVRRVVSFGLKMLERLDRANQLEGARFLELSPAVLDIDAKGPARTVLRIASDFATRQPGLRASVLGLALRALKHPVTDVQLRAAELIARWRGQLTKKMKASLRCCSEQTSPAARDLLTRSMGLTLEADARDGTGSARLVDVDALRDRVHRLDAPARRRVGLDSESGSDSLGGDALRWPSPLELDILEANVLAEAERLVPVRSLDELIARVSIAVSAVDSPEEVELILDGLSRFGAWRPHDFGARTKELLGDVESKRFTASTGLVMGGSGPTLAFEDLLTTWLTGLRSNTVLARWFYRSEHFVFLERRIEEVTQRVAVGREAALLATPTHRRGWIQPRTLVERLRWVEEDAAKGHVADFIQALLRLAPEGREDALAEAFTLRTRWGRILRWALGGLERPAHDDQKDYALWLAAARARGPHVDWSSELSALRLVDESPDALVPAKFEWKASTKKESRFGRTRIRARLEIAARLEPPSRTACPRDHVLPLDLYAAAARRERGQKRTRWQDIPPSVLARAQARPFWRSSFREAAWLTKSLALYWPLNPEGAFAVGARALGERVDRDRADRWPHHAYLAALFDRTRPWREMAVLLVSVALVSSDSDASTCARDVLIEGVEDGRAHPERLASALVRIARGGWLKPNRLARSFAFVAKASDPHGLFVAMAIDLFLGRVDPLPSRLHHLLELQWNLTLRFRLDPSPATKAVLERLRGASKSGELASKLLEFTGDPTLSELIVAGVIGARLDRLSSLSSSSSAGSAIIG